MVRTSNKSGRSKGRGATEHGKEDGGSGGGGGELHLVVVQFKLLNWYYEIVRMQTDNIDFFPKSNGS